MSAKKEAKTSKPAPPMNSLNYPMAATELAMRLKHENQRGLGGLGFGGIDWMFVFWVVVFGLIWLAWRYLDSRYPVLTAGGDLHIRLTESLLHSQFFG